jgi:hypothetical protein
MVTALRDGVELVGITCDKCGERYDVRPKDVDLPAWLK